MITNQTTGGTILRTERKPSVVSLHLQPRDDFLELFAIWFMFSIWLAYYLFETSL